MSQKIKVKVTRDLYFHGRNVGLGQHPFKFKPGTYELAAKVANWLIDNNHATKEKKEK